MMLTLRHLTRTTTLAVALTVQACAVASPAETSGLKRLAAPEIARIATPPTSFRSTTVSNLYHLAAGGALTVTSGAETHVGAWAQRGDRLCVAIPRTAEPDCFEVHRAADGAFRFRDRSGTLSERFIRTP